MSKFSVLSIVMTAACLAGAWTLGKRESALADLQPNILSARGDSGISDTSSCPCFNLEVLEDVQWSAQAPDGPNCKAGSPLWSIASPPTGIVNAASIHTDLSSCVLVIEFGPAAGAFKLDDRGALLPGAKPPMWDDSGTIAGKHREPISPGVSQFGDFGKQL